MTCKSKKKMQSYLQTCIRTSIEPSFSCDILQQTSHKIVLYLKQIKSADRK